MAQGFVNDGPRHSEVTCARDDWGSALPDDVGARRPTQILVSSARAVSIDRAVRGAPPIWPAVVAHIRSDVSDSRTAHHRLADGLCRRQDDHLTRRRGARTGSAVAPASSRPVSSVPGVRSTSLNGDADRNACCESATRAFGCVFDDEAFNPRPGGQRRARSQRHRRPERRST